ncbi:hypothetical protein C362_04036 [Cryptococcus neoformans Bt1]|nr:hypothetical protein C362_04036 [Cryptococcus neoformans var. grubii Bt1]OXG19757.1 hypothetical protein C367_04449 [Cryptococcus neoformans var. grubii Ze90-1]
MPNPPPGDFEQWRSPQSQQTPLTEPTNLPGIFSPKTDSPALKQQGNTDLIHPSFLPPCEHGDDGDMHAHAFDLLSLSNGTPVHVPRPLPVHSQTAPQTVPSSVPSHPSYLSATRPQVTQEKAGKENAPKARRMSSSTTGVLGRGKLGLTGTGESGSGLSGVGKDSNRTTSSAGPAGMTRRSTLGTSPAPQLFDFAKTDRRPSLSRPAPTAAPLPTRSASALPGSLPTKGQLKAPTPPEDDIELDMEFGDDDDDEDSRARSGSADDIDMDEDEIEPGDDGARPEWEKLALGTGSGGVKGRRKGMVFKCETCNKEYRHPSCLVKHRWEHSPHWKEPTALSMSKHQQVQMLEAAAILAHLDPTSQGGRSLPSDKSLWPAILSPGGSNDSLPKRATSRAAREVSLGRSPSISTAAPLTPSSLRETTALGTLAEKAERKSSPAAASDSTTSSMGAAEPYIPRSSGAHPSPRTVPSGLGIRSPPTSSPYARPARPMGISSPRPATSISSSIPGPATPHSIGSLPDMAGLNFSSSLSSSLTVPGLSPMPGSIGSVRRGSLGMPTYMKTGMVGGGMFGVRTQVPSSSVRSGAGVAEEDEEEGAKEEEDGWGDIKEDKREGEEWGMAMEMEL